MYSFYIYLSLLVASVFSCAQSHWLSPKPQDSLDLFKVIFKRSSVWDKTCLQVFWYPLLSLNVKPTTVPGLSSSCCLFVILLCSLVFVLAGCKCCRRIRFYHGPALIWKLRLTRGFAFHCHSCLPPRFRSKVHTPRYPQHTHIIWVILWFTGRGWLWWICAKQRQQKLNGA